MNRRHFLSLLGIGAASVIPAVKALAASGAVKRAKPTKDIGYAEDRVTGERIDLSSFERAMAGKITVRAESEVGIVHWGVFPENVRKICLSEDCPANWELVQDKDGTTFRKHRKYELPKVISCETGKKGDIISCWEIW